MTSLIKVPFASSGDKTAVPETDASGGVNMTQGYGQAYSLDPATDPSAKRIERDKMNWIFNLITKAINEIQTTGIAPFITSADNGGSPFLYGQGAMVSLAGVVYQSLEAANTTTPPGAKWAEVKNAANGLTRANPFADIKADGATAIASALANLGFQEGTNWVKLPSGLIIQKGTTGYGVGVSQVNVTLPRAFTRADYGVVMTWSDRNNVAGTVVEPASVAVIALSKKVTGFTAWQNGAGGYNVDYIAMGY